MADRLTPALYGQRKLSPPRAAFASVVRAPTDELVAPREGVSLVLVTAPAGFGKTSLLRTVYERRVAARERAVWLSLDSADNDPQILLRYLEEALGGSAPANGTITPEDVIARLGDLALSGETLSVFLDDVHVLSDGTALGLIDDLITAVSGTGVVFVGARRMPELRIGRLRAQGGVLEVGAEDLRFSAGESEELVASVLGERLAPELVSSLHERADGWAAVIQLAALSLSKRRDRAAYVAGFSADSEELGGYLTEEILATQPDDVRELMLRSSICESFCAELCDELREASDSEELLRRVERENLCLFRLDEDGRWFRFHDLFAEYLRQQLHREQRAEIPGLHRRAADWFAQHARKATALKHAGLSGDAQYVAEVADGFSQELANAGRLTTLIRAVQPLPKAVLDRWPRLKVYYVVCLCGAFQHRTAGPLIEELSEERVMASLDPVTRGALLFAIPFQMLLQDRFADALAAADANIPQLDPDDVQAHAALINVRTACLLHLHRFGEIEELEAEVRGLATGASTYALVSAECLAGMSELAQGRLSNATAIFEAALETAVRETSATSAPTAIAAACLAEARYEAGQLDEAAELLDRHLSTITHLGLTDSVIHAHVHHIRTTYWRQGYAEACDAVHTLKRLGYERDLPRAVATAWAEHSRLALSEGDLPAAERYLQMAEVNGPYTSLWDESSTTLRARLLTAKGRPLDALKLLDAVPVTCKREELKRLIVRAEALRAASRATEALRTIGGSIADARRESYVRLFVDEGAAMATVLRDLLAKRSQDEETRAFITALLERCDEEQRAYADPAEPHESLSSRELEVLVHIANGLSNQAIADELILSPPTIKSHVRNILGKLAAKNRTEAVAAARRLSLLGP